MGALSLTAAAVSGLELPAWPDRHVLVAPPFIEPVSLSVHRAPFEPTSLRASRAPDGAHHVPGFDQIPNTVHPDAYMAYRLGRASFFVRLQILASSNSERQLWLPDGVAAASCA